MIQFDPTFQSLIVFYLSPVMLGVILCIFFFIILAFLLQKYPTSRGILSFDILYERVFRFYEDILGSNISSSIKTYITTLFFVILLANIAGVILDFIAPIFGISGS